MDPHQIRLPKPLWDDLVKEAEAADLSTSEYIRHLLATRHHTDTSDLHALQDELAALRERVRALKTHHGDTRPSDAYSGRSHEPHGETKDTPPSTGDTSEARDTAASTTTSGDTATEPDIGQLLDQLAWSHGQTTRDRQASRTVVIAATEWLAHHGREVRRGDVEDAVGLTEIDPEGRSAGTLWEEVVRDAWTRLIEEGLIEKPSVRTYRWVGDKS